MTQPVTSSEPVLATSIDLIYPIAVSSYEWAQKKNESLDSRIYTLLAFGAGILLVVPFQIHSNLNSANFSSASFVGSVIAFLAALIVGIVARMRVKLAQLHPQVLYEHYAALSPHEFKTQLIKHAGHDLDENREFLRHKKDQISLMLGCFGLGGILLLLWLLFSIY